MNPYDPSDYYSMCSFDSANGGGAAVTVDLDKALAYDRTLAAAGEEPSWPKFCARVEQALDQAWGRREAYEKLEQERRARYPFLYGLTGPVGG